MDESNSFPRKMSNSKLKLSDLNPHLMCVLCGGYYIDATTIVECLHSFCRSCIVKHLESSKYCPICEVQVHKTKPLINIRPDKTLQDIVYKLVPGLFANEMRNRRKFYRERPHYIKPNNSESAGEVSGERKVYVNDENITFSLDYDGTGSVSGNVGNDGYREISLPILSEKKYFKCLTGVTVYHLKKLLKTKYELNESNYKIEIYLKSQLLHEELTLLDISYIYLWKSKGNLDLTYKIFENVVKRQKMDFESRFGGKSKEVVENDDSARPIEIRPETIQKVNGEIGEMRVDTEVKEKSEEVEKTENSREPPSNLPEETIADPETGGGSAMMTITETETNPPGRVGENGVQGGESKEVQLRISESGVMSVSRVEDGEIVRTMEESSPKAINNRIVTGLSLGLEEGKLEKKEVTEAGPAVGPAAVAPPVRDNGERRPESEGTKRIAGETQRKATPKPVKPYKTIRCSPKTWHPVIPKEKLRPTLMKNSDEPKKPLKFFKMRNMPRFLGNPSSGVKPMYAEPPENKMDENKSREKKAENTRNKIIKIDPKTLRPIDKDEMKLAQTPNVPNLLTNPFIPNNNHFLFSDLHLLPPNAGNFSNSKADSPKGDKGGSGVFKTAPPNGSSSHPPICFPSPDHNPGFYPFSNLSKHQNFPFPVSEKMDPLLRASRLSPFANLSGFNVAGFHASLPPSISRLLNPHHHFRKINQSLEKKNKGESGNEATGNDRDEGAIGSKASAESTVEGSREKRPTEKSRSPTEGEEKRMEKGEEVAGGEAGGDEKKKETEEEKKEEKEEKNEEGEGKETGKSASKSDSISQNNNKAIDRDKES